MPRLEHRVDIERLPREMRLMLQVFLEEINFVRQEAGLPPRTPAEIRQRLCALLRQREVS